NLTAFTGVDSQNLPDVMVSVQFILAIGEKIIFFPPAFSQKHKKSETFQRSFTLFINTVCYFSSYHSVW
ncbi:hypothetical protein, partial [Lactobacillus delbrueckii]